MPSHDQPRCLHLIGAGPMASEYAKVLRAQDVGFQVVGRSAASAKEFERRFSVPVHTGGLERHLADGPVPSAAIVAVGAEQLARVTTALARAGVERILVEKPGALDLSQLENVLAASRSTGAQIWVAYNRRFFASTLAAHRIIEEDGGLSSFHFEFTEWSHQIVKLAKPAQVLAQWFFLNSTHVIDLAFHFGGPPARMQGYAGGSLSWHPAAAVFCGAGVTDREALFSYHANWEAPGRWGLELLTRRHRLVLRPLEKLMLQQIGSVEFAPVALDDELDSRFKPGLYRQVEAFITGNDVDRLPTLEQQWQFASTITNSMLQTV